MVKFFNLFKPFLNKSANFDLFYLDIDILAVVLITFVMTIWIPTLNSDRIFQLKSDSITI